MRAGAKRQHERTATCLGFDQDGAAEDLSLAHGSEMRTPVPQVDPAVSRGAPRDQPAGRYGPLWRKSPMTDAPAAPGERADMTLAFLENKKARDPSSVIASMM